MESKKREFWCFSHFRKVGSWIVFWCGYIVSDDKSISPTEICPTLNTWITKIDFNGEYIVAGTGPREYFFEGESVSPDKIQCKEIIQPEPFEKYLSKMDGGDLETEGECVGNCIDGGDKDGEDEDSICVEFDNNKEACLAHSDECTWFPEEKICEKRTETKRESNCSNDRCEPPEETFESCPEDCCPPTGCKGVLEEKGKPAETEKGEKSFFAAIIEFFRRLLGK